MTFLRADVDQFYHKLDHQSPRRGRCVGKNGIAVDGVRVLIKVEGIRLKTALMWPFFL